MQADPWHTNAAGYELIAQALVNVLKKNSKVRDYLQKMNDSHSTSAAPR
jgi:lysophospholipase L1-like esterase